MFVCMCMLSHFNCVQVFATPWTVVHEVPLSMGFSRQEYGVGVSFPPEDLPVPETELMSLMSPALAGGFLTSSTTFNTL